MGHGDNDSGELEKLHNECVAKILDLDELWRTWLYEETLDSDDALRQFAMADMTIPGRLWDIDPQRASELAVLLAQQLPVLHAMVMAIVDIKDSGLNPMNTYLRLLNFYPHLPRNCLNAADVLIKPRKPDKLRLPSNLGTPEGPSVCEP